MPRALQWDKKFPTEAHKVSFHGHGTNTWLDDDGLDLGRTDIVVASDCQLVVNDIQRGTSGMYASIVKETRPQVSLLDVPSSSLEESLICIPTNLFFDQ